MGVERAVELRASRLVAHGKVPRLLSGVGDLAGSAFSVRFGLGVGFSESPFFFGPGDFSGPAFGSFLLAGAFVGSGVSTVPAFGLRFGFGVTSSSSSPAFLSSAFAFGLGAADSSSSAAGVFFGRGVLVGSGVGLAFGLELVFFLVFDFRVAGFGLAFASDFSAGVGEATARISSLALRASRFFFSSSVSWAWTSEPTMAARARATPKKTRSRITAGERNRERWVINSRKISESSGLRHGGRRGRCSVPFPPQDRV